MNCQTCGRKPKDGRLLQAYRPEAEGALECHACGTSPAEESRMNNEQRAHYGLLLREEGEDV